MFYLSVTANFSCGGTDRHSPAYSYVIVTQLTLTVYQNFLYSFWSSWKVLPGSFLNPHIIYKTEHLKVLYWLHYVPSVAFCVDLSLFKAEEHIHMLPVSISFCTKKNWPYKQMFSCSAVAFTAFYHANNLVAIARLDYVFNHGQRIVYGRVSNQLQHNTQHLK